MIDVEALQRELFVQRQENVALRSQVSQLIVQLAKLNERVGELLAIAQRQQRRTLAEKPTATAPSVEGEAKRAFDGFPKAPDKPAKSELP